MNNNYFFVFVIVLTLLLTGCQSPTYSKIYGKNWNCEIDKSSDYYMQFAEDDIYAVFKLKQINRLLPRLRTDFDFPSGIVDIVSIKVTENNQRPRRLMKGDQKFGVCGDYFIKSESFDSDGLTIFTDLHKEVGTKNLIWQILYIDNYKRIIKAEKYLSVEQQS